jgi:DNA-binding LacI/PurR family transcriptional regulator
MPNFLNVPITYVLHSGHEIGQTAMALLHEQICRETVLPVSNIVQMPTTLIRI